MIEMLTDKSICTGENEQGKPVYRAQLIADGKALLLDNAGVWCDLSDGSEVSGT